MGWPTLCWLMVLGSFGEILKALLRVTDMESSVIFKEGGPVFVSKLFVSPHKHVAPHRPSWFRVLAASFTKVLLSYCL